MTEQSLLSFDVGLSQIEQDYLVWRELPGAKHILKYFYATTAAYVSQWKKSGVPVSATLIMELVRHKVKHGISRAVRADINMSKWDGYSVCNNFRPYIAREIMARRPEWAGIFETRVLNNEK